MTRDSRSQGDCPGQSREVAPGSGGVATIQPGPRTPGNPPGVWPEPPVTGWRARALCADPRLDPGLWFPEAGQSPRAVRVCRACPVQAECLVFALQLGPLDGIWGGLTAAERRRLPGPRTRPCKRCGEPARLPARYCGDECRRAARRKVIADSDRRRKAAA
jgi:WhiB family transcriptional regulator, redox-sensing transcriptional regulator